MLANQMLSDQIGVAQKGAVKAVSQWHFREAMTWGDVMRVFDNYTIAKLTMNRLKEAIDDQGPKRPS
jgi:hypothetical protein